MPPDQHDQHRQADRHWHRVVLLAGLKGKTITHFNFSNMRIGCFFFLSWDQTNHLKASLWAEGMYNKRMKEDSIMILSDFITYRS